MRIMYVSTQGVWGGVATYLKPLMENQLNKGNEVSLVVGNEGELTDYVKNNLPEVKVILLSSMKRDVDILGIFKSIFEFRKIVKNENPDVIHLNCIMAGIIGRIGSVFMKKGIIYNAHGWAFGPRVSKIYKFPAILIEKSLALITDKIICVSEYEQKSAEKYHIFKNKKQAVVIKNSSSDLGVCDDAELSDEVFRVSMAARFLEPKDQLSLIKGFNAFIEKNDKKQVRLYLLGDGPNLKKCKDFVNDNNLNENIVFTGRVDSVKEYYSISDVVALITNYDAIALSLIEALSMGKPIIASDVGGISENFSSNQTNGFCLKNNSPELIAEYLLKMYDNKDMLKNMGKVSRDIYLSNFTIDKNINKHDDLYNQVFFMKNGRGKN